MTKIVVISQIFNPLTNYVSAQKNQELGTATLVKIKKKKKLTLISGFVQGCMVALIGHKF